MDVSAERFTPFRVSAAVDDGVLVLSDHRAFAHDEHAYDAQYDHEAPDAGPGNRLVAILSECGMQPGGAALEIGCGTGLLSVGLAQSGFFGHLVVSDGSMSFVRIAKRKLDGVQSDSRVDLALLQADDIDQIADATFDVIAMRSVLHHVEAFNPFIDTLMSKLKPGGILCCLEPRAESFMWMGTVMALFPMMAAGAGIPLDDEERTQIQLFIDTMAFYLRRDLDKAAAEDKYAFWIPELLEAARRNHAQTSFFSEETTANALPLMVSYLKYCMGFSATLLEKIEAGLEPIRETIGIFTSGGHAPDLAGWFVFKRC